MPLPIVIFAAAQAAAAAAQTSIWVYVVGVGGAGTAIGGGGVVYYYRDSIHNWWYPKACEALPENNPIKKQSTIIQDARNRTGEVQVKLVKVSEAKNEALTDTKQNAQKIEEVVIDVQNNAVVKQETFESLLKKITEEKSEKLDDVLSALEQIKGTLTFSQVGTIQSVMEMAKENQAHRKASAKKDRIIDMHIKINSVLEERLMAFEGALEEKNSSNITFRKD